MRRIFFSTPSFIALLLSVISLPLSAQRAAAETLNHGGYSERFEHGGDQTPPECQITAPDSAAQPFLVEWYCTDDTGKSDEIRSELWMYRGEGLAGELVGSFLGFPANVRVTAEVMKVGRFKDGPPVSFKLLARDRAGNATISPVLTVGTKSEAAAQCTLSITTEATTDTPAKTVTATNVAVSTIKTGANAVTIEAKESVVGDPCDATTTVCSEDSKISFAAEVTFAENGDASGTVTVTPGDLTDVSTTGSGKNSTTGFESIELSGEVTVEGETGILNLSCKNG